MALFALRRLLLSIPLLIGITFVSFVVISLAPGGPLDFLTPEDPNASPEVKERLVKEFGLDRPIHVQYWQWLKRAVRLDFGRSFLPDGRPVLTKIGERLPVTLFLNVIELAIIVWLAVLLMILFGVQLGWLPISGLRSLNWEYLSFWQQQWDFFAHLVLPIVVATFGGLAGFSRYMRQSMLEVVRQDYVQTARAKGLSERVVISKHALRNALLPVITILALALPGLIGGSVIIESIFAIPGMGQLMVQSVFSRDYPVVMGNLVIVASLTLVANLVADITYGLVDPRIRFGGRRGRRS